jgi:hypothetical protein
VAATAGRRAALRLTPIAAPNAFGNDRYGSYWGADNVNEDAAGFVGTAALLLALTGLCRRGGRRPQEGLWLAAVALCLPLVGQAPGVARWLARIPWGSVSGYHHRLLLPLGFGLAVLAACELDRRLRGSGQPWSLALATLALAGLDVWAYLALRAPGDPLRLDVLRWGSLVWHLRTLIATALLLALVRRFRWAGLGIPAVVAVELLALLGPANPSAGRRLAWPLTAPVAFLRERLGDDRLTGLDLALLPNLAAVHGLADARLYNPLAPAAYAALTRPVTVGWTGEVPDLGRPDHPLYDLLGVRFVLAPAGAELPATLSRAFEDPAGTVWERPRPLARLFLPAAAEPLTADWPSRVGGIADFAALALAAELPGGAWRAGRLEAGTVRLEAQEAAWLRARFRAPEARLLATSLYQDGGWRLLAGGRRLPTTRTNGPFLGAWLPAGDHRLDLLYRPLPFVAGCLLAALALAAGTAWFLPPPAAGSPPPARRRSRASGG